MLSKLLFPEEEAPKFLKRFMGSLAVGQKSGDKKGLDIGIRSHKNEPKVIIFETFTISKANFGEYFDTSKEYMGKGLFTISFVIAAKNEEGINTLETTLEKMKR